MNTELANLTKEIDRIAQSQQDNVEWGRGMMNLSCVERIYTIAKRRYEDSLEPLHPCERPGERADNDWFKVKCLAEILLEEAS